MNKTEAEIQNEIYIFREKSGALRRFLEVHYESKLWINLEEDLSQALHRVVAVEREEILQELAPYVKY